MNRISLTIFSLFLIMVLSCCGCGKKGPPVLPRGHSSVSISENEGEENFHSFIHHSPHRRGIQSKIL
jgi:predicted small lipoprotein YifL